MARLQVQACRLGKGYNVVEIRLVAVGLNTILFSMYFQTDVILLLLNYKTIQYLTQYIIITS